MAKLKYPIYNSAAHFALSSIDFCLNFLPKKINKPILPPKRLLISNIAHIGDALLTTSILAPLKKAYPDVKIGILSGSWASAVFEKHPHIEWRHTIDHWKLNRISKRKFWNYVRSRQKALNEVKKIGYDIAVDCNFHFPNMAPFLWSTHIPVRIGFESAGFGQLLTHCLQWSPKENRPAAEAFFSLIELIPALSSHKNLLHPSLHFQQKKKENYLVFHIGAGDSKRMWPIEKWRALTKALVEEKYVLYFTGKGDREKSEIQKITAGLSSTIDLCDQLNWSEFVDTIQRASLVVGLESSAGHIASAVGTTAILLYTSMHQNLVWQPYCQHNLILRKELPCSPCYKGCEEMACIRDISVESVYKAVKSIMPRPTFPLESSDKSSLTSFNPVS